MLCCAEQVQMPNSLEYQPVECAIVVNAAGASSGKLAEMLGIGSGSESSIAGIPVPVEPRKRSAVDLKRTTQLLSTCFLSEPWLFRWFRSLTSAVMVTMLSSTSSNL